MSWYRDMFAQEDPLRSEYYGENDRSRMQVDFIVEKLGLQPGARVLDLCCGQGRHLIELARRGYDVVGVDLSEYMLGKLRAFAAAEGIEPVLVNCDMREIAFDREFDAAINMWTAFGYLETEEDDLKVLQGVARALKPGGRFMLDMMNRDRLMNQFRPNDWQQNEDGTIIVSERSFDSIRGRQHCRETAIATDGRRTQREIDLRIYTFREMEELLKQAGFTVETVMGDWDGLPYAFESARMLTIARAA